MFKTMSRLYLALLVLVILLFSGIGTAQPKAVKITLLNSKGEVQAPLEEAAKIFAKENSGVTLEIIPCPAGQSPFEKISLLYAAGSAPTLAMLDGGDLPKLKSKLADLSNEKWIKDAADNTLDDATIDGKVIAFPFAVEGYGFIYNKVVLDKAFRGKFDPAAIKTTKDLEEAFKKVEASGVASLVISPMDWSLGAHYLALAYSDQSSDNVMIDEFLQALKKGRVDLANNKVLNGLLDTFDVMKKYNRAKKDPLSITYEKGPELLGKGEIGFWFMGNWAWPQIKSFDTVKEAYGFLPVPISNNAKNYGNTGIAASVTKFIIMDNEQNSKVQQTAAKEFLQWLIYSKSGQEALVKKANIIPAFKNITLEPADPLSRSIQNYLANKQTIKAMTTLPSDHWARLGASMQKYLAGISDRAILLKEIEAYWKRVK